MRKIKRGTQHTMPDNFNRLRVYPDGITDGDGPEIWVSDELGKTWIVIGLENLADALIVHGFKLTKDGKRLFTSPAPIPAPEPDPSPVPPPVGADAIDPRTIRWDEPAGIVGDWQRDVTLTSWQINGGKFSWQQTGATWPSKQLPSWDKPAIGNIWVIAKCGDKWHGATWDWIGPGARTKQLPDFAKHNDIHGCLEGWTPQRGERVCWMLSTFARSGQIGTAQRSNIMCGEWR